MLEMHLAWRALGRGGAGPDPVLWREASASLLPLIEEDLLESVLTGIAATQEGRVVLHAPQRWRFAPVDRPLRPGWPATAATSHSGSFTLWVRPGRRWMSLLPHERETIRANSPLRFLDSGVPAPLQRLVPTRACRLPGGDFLMLDAPAGPARAA